MTYGRKSKLREPSRMFVCSIQGCLWKVYPRNSYSNNNCPYKCEMDSDTLEVQRATYGLTDIKMRKGNTNIPILMKFNELWQQNASNDVQSHSLYSAAEHFQ